MNLLVVTDQRIMILNNTMVCQENVYDILKRFSNLGKMSICCPKKIDQKALNLYDSPTTEFFSRENVYFVKRSYFFPEKETNKTIEQCVKKIDLVIGYVPCVNAYTALKFAKKYNKKFMAYVVACPWDAFWNYSIKGKFIASYAYWALRKCLKESDYALYVTTHFLQKRYPCKGLTCGCSDVRIPRLDEKILEERLRLLSNLNMNQTINLATIAGYSIRFKGQHFVIEALAKLKKMGITRFHYHLIGSGNKARLENLAKELNVLELVHFDGIVPHSQIFTKLDEMHIYIQPSLQEGLPRAVVEAMSRGLTCVCANTAAMPEMVESRYVVQRKSVDDIVNVLKNISIEKMTEQAKRNFEEAKKYEESVLDAKRNGFFERIKKIME